MICTGQFKDAHKIGHEVVTRLSKAQVGSLVNIVITSELTYGVKVCADLGAKLLIDDSIENAMQCATATPPTTTLLFGNYQWNQRMCGPGDDKDEMAFDQRLASEGGREFWKDDVVSIPDGALLYRVKDWSEAVRWVQRARTEGKL